MPHQRASDDPENSSYQRRIDDLIEQTNNQELKVVLLLFSRSNARWEQVAERIADRLDTMGKGQQDLAVQHTEFHRAFLAHETHETKILYSMRGAWWAGTIVFCALLATAGFIGNSYKTQVEDLQRRTLDLERRVTISEQRSLLLHPAL